MPSALRALACAVFALSAAACDTGDEGDAVGEGRFEATLTGDVEAELAGPAQFMFFGDPREPRVPSDDLSISLQASLFQSIAIGFQGLPATGAYTVRPDDARSPTVLFFDFQSETLVSTAGTVTITTATERRIAGTFRASLESLRPDEGVEPTRVEATGAFDAPFVESPFVVARAAREAPPSR